MAVLARNSSVSTAFPLSQSCVCEYEVLISLIQPLKTICLESVELIQLTRPKKAHGTVHEGLGAVAKLKALL